MATRRVSASWLVGSFLLLVGVRAPAETYTVTNANATGDGSLAAALALANADPALDLIDFAIPGVGPFAITPTAQLVINQPVTIDGTTQPGYGGVPLIWLSGTEWIDGPVVNAGGSTLRGLCLTGARSYGVLLRGSGSHVESCWIGVAPNGSAAGNWGMGIYARGDHHVVGGLAEGLGNVIAGNRGAGIEFETVTAGQILGNRIGLNLPGTGELANGGHGIALNQSPDTVIGGPVLATRNVISGNQGYGIHVQQQSTGVTIKGNWVGLDTTGEFAVPNTSGGVHVAAVGGVVGGPEPGAGNVIAGNQRVGLSTWANVSLVVQGNRIGTNAAGDRAVPNTGHGLELGANVTVGGPGPGEGNLISGNGGHGLSVGAAYNVTIQGNRIGTNAAGTAALPNAEHGLSVGGADGQFDHQILIGGASTFNPDGTLSGPGNLVSGNLKHGLSIGQFEGTRVQGNYVGTDVTGSRAIGNGWAGISSLGYPTIIGGDQPGQRNVVSGNDIGLSLGAYGHGTLHEVYGNYIGTDWAGQRAVPNRLGIWCYSGAKLGDLPAQPFAAAQLEGRGNLISGNREWGVEIESGDTLQGNYIGTDVSGTRALPNGAGGVHAAGSVTDVVGNLVSGNQGLGLYFRQVGRLLNNRIGTAVDGRTPLPNAGSGLVLWNRYRCQVGGPVAGESNVIAFNQADGVLVGYDPLLQQDQLAQATIRGNSIHHNGGLGIKLGSGAMAPNDGLQTAERGNLLTDRPVLTSAVTRSEVVIAGSYQLFPDRTYTFDFYSSTEADPGGYGEGEQYLGSLDALANSEGHLTFQASFPAASLVGPVITATATTAEGLTSDFSNAVNLDALDLTLTKVASANPVAVGADLTYTITVTNQREAAWPNVSVTDVLPPTVTFVSTTASQGTAAYNNGVVAAELGDLAGHAQATVTVVVRPTARGAVTNSAIAMTEGGSVTASAVTSVLGPPDAPTLLAPDDGTTLARLPLAFQVQAVDGEGDDLRYRLELLRDGTPVATYDQTRAAGAGTWDKERYANGEQATLTVAALDAGTYTWRAAAHDGTSWGPWSDLRSFTVPAAQWTMFGPHGAVVQVPLLRFAALVNGAAADAQVQYRVEVATNEQFSGPLKVFDQSRGTGAWPAASFTNGARAGLALDPQLELGRRYHYRVRVRTLGSEAWSDPSPTQEFWLESGFQVLMGWAVRLNRPNSFNVELINNSDTPQEYCLSFDLRAQGGNFTGEAALYNPAGQEVDRVAVNGDSIEFVTDLVPPGHQTYRVVVQVNGDLNSRSLDRAIPIVVIVIGKIIVGAIISYAVQTACEEAVKRVLQDENGLSKEDADAVWEATKTAGGQLTQSSGQEAAKAILKKELERRGKEELAKKLLEKGVKVGAKRIPYVGLLFSLVDCLQGVFNGATATSEERPLVQSSDPNEKIGITGRNGYIQPTTELPYRINYENKAAATAPAQEVVITDVLDGDLDLSSLVFTSAGFGSHEVTPAESATLSEDLDLRPDRNLVVQIRGAVDPATRLLTVTFRGLNPDTGQLDEVGFLPPNQTPPEGEGHVSFRLRPAAGVASGTAITNQARIVFDGEQPLDTNEVGVVVDHVPPTSQSTTAALGRACDCGASSGTIVVGYQAADATAGVEQVELWVHAEPAGAASRATVVDGLEYALAATATAAQGEFRLPGKFGYRYRCYTVARDAAGNEEAVPAQPDQTLVVGPAPTFSAGLHLLAVPVESETPDPRTVFGLTSNRWSRYDPAANNAQGAYVNIANDPAGYTMFQAPTAVPGRAYWARFDAPVQPAIQGPLPHDTVPYAVPLAPGWNQVGNPFLRAVTWSLTGLTVRREGTELTLAQARAAGWLEAYGWVWRPDDADPAKGAYRLLYDGTELAGVTDQLQPWQGCWVLAKQACELVFPAIRAAAARSREATGGWAFGLRALTDQGEGEVTLGVAAGEPLAVASPPQPPTAGPSVRLTALRDGTSRAVDLLPRATGTGEWTVVVDWSDLPAGRSVSDVILTWPNLRGVPADVSLVLLDPQSGARRALRTTAAWRVRPAPGERQRRFTIRAERGRAPLAVTGLWATPSRGGLRVAFGLSAPATTTVQVQSLAGRPLATLEAGASRAAGLHELAWTGRDAAGRPLPRGAYRVLLVAVDDEGRQARATGVATVR